MQPHVNDKTASAETRLLNSLGIHARPSAMLVEAASTHTNDISISKGHSRADAKSILEVMMLVAGYGDTVCIEVAGPQAHLVLMELKSIVDKDFFEIDCKSALIGFVLRNGERDPDLLAKLISSGDVSQGQPNDLYYWYALGRGDPSSEDIAGELRYELLGIHIIPKDPTEPRQYDVTKHDLQQLAVESENGSRTV